MTLSNCYVEVIVLFSAIALSDSTRLEKIDDTNIYNFNRVDESLLTEEQIRAANNLSTPQSCARRCILNDNKKCYYKFYVEEYSVMGGACDICTPSRNNGCQCILADGVERSAFAVNRMIPGPSIEVCEGDQVIIDVVNMTPASTVTIHWHGILQRGSQFYDGVPGVTQCPILPDNTFRYTWKAEYPGTHFWHSHTGLQKVDGLTGPIVIRQPKHIDPHALLYDYDLFEHTIFVQDWLHEYMDEKFPGRISSDVAQRPDSILVNGKGKYQDPITGVFTDAPLEVFYVSPNSRYRFRFINAFATVCPVQFTIEGHKMVVIATDGNPIVPVEVDTIISASAERYDFVLNTNSVGGTYWIHFKAVEECQSLKIDQVVVLNYTAITQKLQTPRPTYDNPLPIGKLLNPMDTNCSAPRNDAICINQLRSKAKVDRAILGNTVEKIYLPFRFAFNTPENLFKPNTYWRHFVAAGVDLATGLIDNITNETPSSPFLSQYNDIDLERFCNGDQPPNDCGLMCKCSHVIDVPYGSMIEIVLVDEVNVEGIHHPFHLHGYSFYVIGMGKMTELGPANLKKAINLDQQNLLNRQYDNPPAKDTIMIPSSGYVILRFKADNPGFWLLHCHFLMHLITGMSAVLQVGLVEDMPPPPPGFPKCGNYFTLSW